MRRRQILTWLGAWPVGLLVPACKRPRRDGLAPAPSAAPPPSASQSRSPNIPPGLDVTFLVAADTHFGARVKRTSDDTDVPIEEVHETAVREMNGMQARTWPGGIWGKIARPRGLLVAGDLTDDGRDSEWQSFEKYLGRTGSEGKLRMPVFEGIGNHDRNSGDRIVDRVVRRHGSPFYSWDWDGLHLVCLGEAPDDTALRWLERDLSAIGPYRPVVVYFHYPLAGPWTKGNWFGDGDYRERLAAVLSRSTVVGIFHGHFHATGYYRWLGRDVFTPGSAKHRWRSFLVVRVTSEKIDVACWDYEYRAWWWWVSRPFAIGDEPLVEARNVGRGNPLIPYPIHDQ